MSNILDFVSTYQLFVPVQSNVSTLFSEIDDVGNSRSRILNGEEREGKEGGMENFFPRRTSHFAFFLRRVSPLLTSNASIKAHIDL